jgi:major membrane immunogen (membrane-anchored lipoprotein)
MPIYLSIAGVVLLMSGLVFVFQTIQRPETLLLEGSTAATEETVSVETGFEMDMTAPSFTDGTYTTSFAYEVPYGYTEPMEVSLVFENGVITDSEVQLEAENPTSEEYQNWFMEYYKDEVVGQLIDVVSLVRVGGASLTNNAFDVALAAAKAEAIGTRMTVPEIVPINLPTYQRNVDSADLENVSFKDGTYTIEDAYFVMAGLSEPMRTTVTLDDGIITDASVAFDTQDIHSEYYQRDFSAAYKSKVVGVSISDVPFSRIGGASLTTGGFNDALQKVMNQAVET